MSKDNNTEPEYRILNENYEKCDLKFKIIVIGNMSVGKSWLSIQATKKTFDNSILPTLCCDYLNFNIEIKSKKLKLTIWDTCGQEEYKSLVVQYFLKVRLL